MIIVRSIVRTIERSITKGREVSRFHLCSPEKLGLIVGYDGPNRQELSRSDNQIFSSCSTPTSAGKQGARFLAVAFVI